MVAGSGDKIGAVKQAILIDLLPIELAVVVKANLHEML